MRRSVTFKTQLWLTPSSFLASFSGVCLIKFLLAAGRNDGLKLGVKSQVSKLFETSILHFTQHTNIINIKDQGFRCSLMLNLDDK